MRLSERSEPRDNPASFSSRIIPVLHRHDPPLLSAFSSREDPSPDKLIFPQTQSQNEKNMLRYKIILALLALFVGVAAAQQKVMPSTYTAFT